jgi:hypothetical protein
VTTLFENPLPVLVAGGLLAVLALVVFLARRSGAALLALVGVIALTLLLVLVERLVVTDREHVENALAGVLDAIEANDVSATVEFIDPAAAKIRADAQALMPQIKVEAANAAAVDVTVDDAAQPPAAIARFRAYLHGTHTASGTPVGYINQQVDLHWVKRGDRWLIDDYTAYFEGEPIDAVGSARGNQPVPTRPTH